MTELLGTSNLMQQPCVLSLAFRFVDHRAVELIHQKYSKIGSCGRWLSGMIIGKLQSMYSRFTLVLGCKWFAWFPWGNETSASEGNHFSVHVCRRYKMFVIHAGIGPRRFVWLYEFWRISISHFSPAAAFFNQQMLCRTLGKSHFWKAQMPNPPRAFCSPLAWPGPTSWERPGSSQRWHVESRVGR